MRKILIATHNPAKEKEIKETLKQILPDVKIVSLKDLKIEKEAEEYGKDFEENAFIKAKFYSHLTSLPTLADDGGLIIPALNNEPGVKSRRWLGYPAEDEELIEYTLKRMKGLKGEERLAYLETCVCFYEPKKRFAIFQSEKIEGYIAEKPSKKRLRGYPFRSLFIVKKFNKYYDELTEKEHNEINHRKKAIKKLFKIINDQFSIFNE